MRKVLDIEANDLLNERTIDYTASPYRPTEYFKLWCLYLRDLDDPTMVEAYIGEAEIDRFLEQRLPWITELAAHNGIDFDFLALKLKYPGKFEYEIDEFDSHNCTINGRQVRIVDTLVLSKTLNPDRFGGHSLDEWGKRTDTPKTDWRKEAIELGLITHSSPKGAEFQQWHPRMGDYCAQDTLTNVKTYHKLMDEWGGWAWEGPFSLEQRVRDIVTRQSHRGFWFDKKLAEANVRDLDAKMEAIRAIVEPLIPPKPMGITKLKAYMPPKIQFKKNGEVSAVMLKWVEKHEGKLFQSDGKWWASFPGHEEPRALPMDQEVPIKTHEPATVKDITHIKGWLVELGWNPSAYKERDLTVDVKKVKLSKEKFLETVERYVEQTLSSPFCKDRCEELGVSRATLASKLKNWQHEKRPLKVYTNPTITVGMEKEIDPALLELADKFPHAKLVSEYLTYSHRRNSILGGGFDPDDLDDDDELTVKGFLSNIRDDGRISTPADTCGAGTSRFKHRVVANIPRVTSLYGDKMRGQFGVDVAEGFVQMGYDFASLEAMIESHYCWKYDKDEGRPYCTSLVQEKPNDVHTKTAAFIQKTVSEAIGRLFPFNRTPAKNVKYCCSYGGQPKRVAKTVGCEERIGDIIYDAFWNAAQPLKELGEKLKQYWETTGNKRFILGIDGRKIPTRSASALINSLFQSAGVICAKRAMVLHERKLQAEGLWVDFFRDDWKAKKFVQQLIAYHDEAQMEMHKALVKWKMIKIEGEWEVPDPDKPGKMKDSPEVEAAKASLKSFKADNPGWSEVGHTDTHLFIGKCRAGELIQEAVRETSKFYKLNVTLAADYIIGRNWGECH